MKSLLTILMSLLPVASIYADTINVPADQPTIQVGIEAAMDGDTVLVANGTYIENINFRGKAITVASHFIVDGDTSHISATIIDGSQPANPNLGSTVTMNSGEDTTSVLSGFTITGGVGNYYAPWDAQVGGGIWIEGGAKITHNRIVNNSIQQFNRIVFGGGITINTGFPTALPNGHAIIKYNLVSQNSCSGHTLVNGGGISINGYGTTLIAYNFITQNSVSAVNTFDQLSGGGGLFVWEENPVIIRNVISDNTASHGGGIAAFGWERGCKLRLINNTIADNHASEKGGGVYLHNGYFNTLNNIFWANSAPEEPDIFYRGNLNINYSITQEDFSGFGTGNLQIDPLFANSAYHLSANSPAIDNGDPDPRFNDPENPNNPGQPLWPAQGTLRADMGAYGGNDTVTVAPEGYPVLENFLYRQFGAMPYRFAYPLNYDSTFSYPLTVVLHGGGLWGTDNEFQLVNGLPWRINAEYFGYNEFTIVPQSPDATGWNSDSNLRTVYDIIQNTIANYSIDTTKIAISGWSSGGGGTWRMPARYPYFFAAAIPLSGTERGFGDIKHLPVWVHHGTADATVSVNVSRDYIARFEATGLTALYPEEMSGSEIQAAIDNDARLFYSEYVGARHVIMRHSNENYYMFEWLKKQRRQVIRPQNVATDKRFLRINQDSLIFTTNFANSQGLPFEKRLILENFDQVRLNTLPLFDDGLHGDSLAQDGIWGYVIPPLSTEDNFRLGVQVDNTTLADTFYFHDLAAFTTKGPIKINSYALVGSDSIPNPGDVLQLRLFLRNHGQSATVKDIEIRMTEIDTCAEQFSNVIRRIDSLQVGEVKAHISSFPVRLNGDCPAPMTAALQVDIYSGSYRLWTDTVYIDMLTGLAENGQIVPREFALYQNYPNPFNPATSIAFDIAKTGWVSLKVFNALGQEVAVLVAEEMLAGTYQYEWDAAGLASGLYYYRLNAGDFVQSRKMLLIR